MVIASIGISCHTLLKQQWCFQLLQCKIIIETIAGDHNGEGNVPWEDNWGTNINTPQAFVSDGLLY